MYNEENNNSQYRFSGKDIPFNSENKEFNQTNGYQTGMQGSGYQTGAQSAGFHNNHGVNSEFGGAAFMQNSFSTTGSYAKPAGGAPLNSGAVQKKKKSSVLKKIAAISAAALLFGTISGAAMVGVNYIGNRTVNANSKQTQINEVNVGNIDKITSDMTDTNLSALTSMNVEAVAQAVLPAMVELNGTTTVSGSSYNYPFGAGYEATTSGTGIIVGQNEEELLIVTNAHVVDGVSNLKCVFVDGASVSATVKGSKADRDIAVVAVSLSNLSDDTASAIAIAELADMDTLAVGQQVVAIGNALGEGQSVTNGIISAMDRSITIDNVTFSGLIMTNAAINSGNSGGALLNAEGKVIAINFAKTSQSGVEGMAYSIPVSNVRDLINSLMNKQIREKVNIEDASYLGIAAVDVSSSTAAVYGYPQGILIRTVADGSPADKAGLEVYDIIVGFDDKSITTMTGLTSLLQYYAAGETVTVDYYHREGSGYVLKSTEVTLGRKAS